MNSSRPVSIASISLALISVVGLAAGAARADNPEHIRQLLQTNTCENCDLSNATLDGLDLAGANLQGANLQGANLLGTQLMRANLSGASLQTANLAGTNLLGANLQNADLSDAQFFNPCEASDFFDAFDGEDGVENNRACYAVGLLQQFGSELCEPAYGLQAVIEDDFFPGFCDSAQRSVQYAIALGYGSFSSAGGVLSWLYPGFGNRVVLAGADLTGANLSNVNLGGVDLRYAQLTAANLQTTQLDYALLLEATGLPEGLSRLNHPLLTQADIGEVIRLYLAREFARHSVVANQSYGTTALGAMNRAQQAYYLENNAFASQLNDLGLGLEAESYHYRLGIDRVEQDYVINTAIAQTADLDSFLGIVYITRGGENDADGLVSHAILCRTPDPWTDLPLIPPRPATIDTEMGCPANFEIISEARAVSVSLSEAED